jgi:hypothetical protein
MFIKKLLGKGDIQILESNDIYHGRSFGDWIGEWWNWLISDDPEYSQIGPIYFLRPGLPREKGTLNFKTVYSKIGTDAVTVYADQAILFPVINSMIDERHFPYLDSQAKRRYQVRNDTSYSPKLALDACKIEKKPIFDNRNGKSWDDLRVESPDFQLHIPNVEYGKSFKDLLDYPLEYAGDYPAVTDGYWVFIKNLPESDDNYTIEWQAKGLDGYSVSAVYEIRVLTR